MTDFVGGHNQGGFSAWVLKNPPPPDKERSTKRFTTMHEKVHYNAQKAPLEYTKRFTNTVILINDVAYNYIAYIDSNLDTVEDRTIKLCYPIS